MIILSSPTRKHEPVTSLKRCYLVTAGILLTGFCAATVIYLTAEDISESPFADFENSKRFTHEVQRMGGKMALVANDAATWFYALWHGQQLAYTVVFITVVIAVVYYVIASDISPEVHAGEPHHKDAG
jgi:small-conductance mechanosensitive channel